MSVRIVRVKLPRDGNYISPDLEEDERIDWDNVYVEIGIKKEIAEEDTEETNNVEEDETSSPLSDLSNEEDEASYNSNDSHDPITCGQLWYLNHVYLKENKEVTADYLEKCNVCLDARAEVETSCNHQYCEICINKWMFKSIKDCERWPACPICRNDLTRLQYLDCSDD